MANRVSYKKIAKQLARAIVRYDNYPFSGGMSERAILLARKITSR
jgi:hypothetical protein